MRSNYNNVTYKMYEEEYNKNFKLLKKIDDLKLENANLKYELKHQKDSVQKKIESEIKKATTPLIEENRSLNDKLSNVYDEINRLKSQLKNKNYNIDKLECSVNKDSTNSGIPTSKEIKCRHPKTGTNTYNHREKSNKKTGGQIGHKGTTLTKEELKNMIEKNGLKVKKVVHYIKGFSKQDDITKYKIGMNVNMYIEEHIFKHVPTSDEVMPKEYYSDVTYNNDLKTMIVVLGNYYCLGYNKVHEILYDFSNGIINISQGTINNIYDKFGDKAEATIDNITNNLLNADYQHTDEITTKQNGKDTYYRGYANPYNVLYKYHNCKGDTPIEEDGILTKFYGTIISDHEVGIFKYGTNNQDCIIHTGRYCIEGNQNVIETEWQMTLYRFLLKIERERKILSKFGKKNFSKEEIKLIEDEYDEIIEIGEKQNKEISSSYWKEKEETFLRRLKKYKKPTLFFIYDFSVPYDNNFMERALRMIKGKTKVSGGFRSNKGGERFGKTMSIIKTAKLRNLNLFVCIKDIFQGNALFA